MRSLAEHRAAVEALRAAGFVVQPRKDSADYLRRFGFQVRTVIDVGVADGTPHLYEAFPEADLLLIDPLPVVERVAEALQAQGRSVRHHVGAVGRECASLAFGVADARQSRSSFHDRTSLTAGPTTRAILVPVRTLDQVAAGELPPFGLKIDTEGHEIEVLAGAAATLRQSAFVQMEVSVKRRFVGGYSFADAIACMADHGFALLDILSQPAASPKLLECLFVPHSSPLLDQR